MTREEAIDYFKRSYASGNTDDERQHNETLDTAIKALEQEPCDDCVSRQAVIKELNNHWLSGSCARRIINEQIDKVKALPPVAPTQRWNTTSPMENTYDILLSSETEYEEPHAWIGCYVDGHYYYADGIIDVDNEVRAWMPLPKPYKLESEDKE